jgi:hypothetical protein
MWDKRDLKLKKKEKRKSTRRERIRVGKVCNFANFIQFFKNFLIFRKINI